MHYLRKKQHMIGSIFIFSTIFIILYSLFLIPHVAAETIETVDSCPSGYTQTGTRTESTEIVVPGSGETVIKAPGTCSGQVVYSAPSYDVCYINETTTVTITYNICEEVTCGEQVTESGTANCSDYHGSYGIPSGYTDGTADYTYTYCSDTGEILDWTVDASGCSEPPVECTVSNVCGQTSTGVIENGTCSASAPSLPSGYGNSCNSSANACGQTNSGTIGCDGTCSASTPSLPSGYGTSCTSASNSCGETNTGVIQCDGTCSASAPSDASCVPETCTSPANACGETADGIIEGGVCSASTPSLPSGYGTSCTSASNSCGETNTGVIQCDGTCSASAPSDASCPTVSASISASPSSITDGDSVSVSWSSSNADTCSVSGISTGGQTSGSRNVRPSTTTTYTATCWSSTSSDSDIATVLVSTPEPEVTIDSFSANPGSIQFENSSNIMWRSTNADSCSITATGGLSQTWSGLAGDGNSTLTPTSAQDVAFTLTCSNASSSDTASMTLTVTEATSAPSVSVTGSTPIISGGSTTLIWSSSDATSCTGTNFSTGGATSGQATVSPTSDTRYTVTCTGPGGEGDDDAIISVRNPDLVITANPQRVLVGRTSTLEWSATDVDSCTVYSPGSIVFDTRDADGGGRVTAQKTISRILPEDTEPKVYTLRCVTEGEYSETNVTITPLVPEFEEI